MSTEADTKGLLEDLQRLSEAGRDRILKLLPPEDVIGVLKASLRERDRSLCDRGPKDEAPVQSKPSATAPNELSISPARPIISSGTVDEDSNVPTKRKVASPISRSHKRTKTENAALQSTKHTTSQHGEPRIQDTHSPVRVVVKQEHESVKADSESDSGNDDNVQSDVRSHTSPNVPIERQQTREDLSMAQIEDDQTNLHTNDQHKNLPIVLDFRGSKGYTNLEPISKLPVAVQSELTRRFTDIWDSNKFRSEAYHRIRNNPDHYMSKLACLRGMLWRGSRTGGPTFGRGGKFKEAADDKCIDAGHPCAHLFKHDGEVGFRLVPLPESLREGKVWTELGYWIQKAKDR